MAIGLVLFSARVQAQDKKALDSVDKVIIKTIIQLAERAAGEAGPNWAAIEAQIWASYSEIQCDRAVTKARIYYYYGKDWAKFCSAIVHYTDAYEDKDDAALMNKNAGFILQRSQNPTEWKAALGWIPHALDKDPESQTYKATRDALSAKLVGH